MPHSIVWKNTGMGLSWLSLSIYDHKTIQELPHFQISVNIQEVHHAKTTISQIEKVENPTFLNGVTHWGEATRERILKKLHPGTFSVVGSL